MKTTKYITLALIALMNFTACSSDDDSIPEVINEEEVITTVMLTLVPQSGATITLASRDLDGEGPNPPIVNVSGSLEAEMLYKGTITLLNETVNPAELINEEIEEEAEAHQFFYQFSPGLNATAIYSDTENQYVSNGSQNPVGIEFALQTGTASTGTLTVTLRHEPSKDAEGVGTGNIANAGGESDVAQSFNVVIE